MPPTRRPSQAAAATSEALDAAAALLVAMPHVMDAFRVAMRHQLDESLSVPHFRALRFVADRRGSSISELAAFLGVTLPTASAMVDRLVKSGHARARVAADDRRRVELAATRAGTTLLERIRRAAQRELAGELGAFDPEELACVLRAMNLLQRSFSHA